MDIDRKFEEFLNSLGEEERKRVLQRMEELDEDGREYFKTFVAILKAEEEFRDEVVRSVIENLNRRELEKVSKEDLVVLLYEVIYQACGDDNGGLHSLGFSAYAKAIRMLAKLGLAEIESESGRVVIGKIKGAYGERR